TSALTSTVPGDPLYTATRPLITGTVTSPVADRPAVKSAISACGRGRPAAKTVRCPAPDGAIADTSSTTAATRDAGTPARPMTRKVMAPSPRTRASRAPSPVWVSRIRAGASGTNRVARGAAGPLVTV